ncbi:HIT domain-containing protein [Candidatus Woesearchaeota archaeon]|nr:HIT domain-containing protein [Candidatus Woesearchaeota archaeon]
MELTEEQRKQLEAQKAQCPFCQIIAGKIPAEKVYEDKKVIAILDINPATQGHLLVMTKEHYPILPLIPKDDFEHLIKTTKEIEQQLKKSILLCDSANIFMANGGAAGQQSPHFMLHIIPRPKDSKVNTFKLKEQQINKEKQNELFEITSHNLKQLMGEQYTKYEDKETEINSKEITSETIFALIEENPKLKELIKLEPEKAKTFIESNEKLKLIFQKFDIKKISEVLNKE